MIDIPSTSTPVTLGQAEFIGYFSGGIDEPALYHRALSQEEIQAIVNADAAGKSASLRVVPAHAGTGLATVRIDGAGFPAGSTVELLRDGEESVLASPVTVWANGLRIDATFDLHDRKPGAWDLVVKSPAGAALAIPGGFTIESAGSPEVWAEVVGLGLIRPGRPQTFHVFYGNKGNVDAVGVPIFIGGFPTNSTVQLGFDVLPPTRLESEEVDYSAVPTSFNTGHEIVVPLLLSMVPAGYVGSLEVTVKVPTAEPFVLRAVPQKSIFGSPIRDNALDCFMVIAGEITGQIIKDDCAVTWSVALHSTLLEMGAGKPVNWVWNGVDLVFACVPDFACGLCTRGRLTPACVVCAATKVAEFGVEVYHDWEAISACASAGYEAGQSLLQIRPVNSFDPNEKVGPAGVGEERFLGDKGPLAYSILFENKDTATAPAQEVVVTDVLDPYRVDLSTLQLGTIHIGTNRLSVPAGLQSYSTVVSLPGVSNLVVAIDATLDPNSARLKWVFRSLDPVTLQPPADPLAGFLPPNLLPPHGEGSVSFSVAARPTTTTGTVVTNSASIVFDLNAAIDTGVWTNSFDITPPVIRVRPLFQPTIGDTVEVSWQTEDLGAGVDRIRVEVSTNRLDYATHVESKGLVSTRFRGLPGVAYWFRVTAIDRLENSVSIDVAADASALSVRFHPLSGEYMTWARQHFSVAADDLSLESTVWGLLADPGGLGSANIFQWYYNQPPNVPIDSRNRMEVHITDGMPLLKVVRRSTPDTALQVFNTAELGQPWVPLPLSIGVTITPLDNRFEMVTWPIGAQEQAQGFYRFSLSLSP